MLASNEDELATFAEGGGLAIDTAVLFHLLRRVKEGALSRDAARRLPVEAAGRFPLDE